MAALQAHHLQRRVSEAADGDNMLLEPPEEDELSTLAEEVLKGQRNEGG
jgi:hypothetical protein